MKNKVRIIPFQVVEQLNQFNEVPEGVALIGAEEVWKQTKGQGITVAVLDTGCEVTHPDLQERIIGGRNFTHDDQQNPDVYQDYNGHGTHVAGTIAAAHNGNGVVGVAPEVNLLILKVLDGNGSGQYEWIIQGITYAIQQKVDIISMSLGGPADVPELHEAIQDAVDQNILVVCAAGNEGDGESSTDEFAYPGSYNEVISVGAVDLEKRSSIFSNSNNEVDVVAPGEKIVSTYLNGKYAALSGTSMATPHVAGALALIKVLSNEMFGRELTEPELYAQLIRRTLPLNESPREVGNGFVHLTIVEKLLREVQRQMTSEVMG
ncbi:S8 family peptidase [Priestia aryabhattai]|uniref:S8 family peptidase n=1 Tax=Priestia aryabhattai TaxID=412384 RepID=UPI00211CA230|nr:S8 family peptidase [Priestia aryabhattai]MCQ9284896.1 S8 family peptidase [Priestia aryabhattai]